MIVTLQTHGLQTLEQIRSFLGGSQALDFDAPRRESAYEFVGQTLLHFGYTRLGRAGKGLIRRYLERLTGLSRAQVTRLISQFGKTGCVRDQRGAPSRPFPRRYTGADILLLAEVDALHGSLSGPATRKLCERAHAVFGDVRFERLSAISNGHLYNLWRSRTYLRRRGNVDRTRPTRISIGERRRPHPEGRPGFLRVDSVHQGDRDGVRGIHHINLVDEVTQFQFVGTVQRISGHFLLPVLEALITSFPFTIHAFHADNGPEYVNHRVAGLLNKLHIQQFTRSRARRTNDNALVESRNGSVVRKHPGYAHIPSRFASRVNRFSQLVLSPYLNFHRPCFFPEETVDARGRLRKRYRYEHMMTPYDRRGSLPGSVQYLKEGVSFAQLDTVAHAMTDNEAADMLNKARAELFRSMHNTPAPAA